MFGKVMSQIKPRMAVGYHVFNDFDTFPQIMKEVRSTYGGPVEIAVDSVFNVTKDDIRVRMAAIDEAVWPQASISAKLDCFSRYIMGGRHVFKDMKRL